VSAISSISSSSNYYSSIASGVKLQKAADGAAELSIAEAAQSQANSYDVGADNAQSAVSALNIEDAALGSITDYLQRIRDLSVQASSDLNSASDKASIQEEIDQLKQGIEDVANTTNYNSINLLDGSEDSLSIATDGNGSSASISTHNSTLEALGIKDFDVTADFDIGAIDKALEDISANRSEVGAKTNNMSHVVAYNKMASLNQTSFVSRLKDTDMASAASEMKKQALLDNYRIMMQKKQQDVQANQTRLMFE